ncbi:hypothetical protein [Acinetobacter sp. YH01026]|uniref:hypothetical protein n=1 Tax=Acinetobacter sp. YH01026 TaxID=2601039 RepID=UPI0015D3C086|nr:hypothetical protein [Acinetobacter sp. YH01026]
MRSPDQIGITWEENQLLMQQLREKAALEHRRQHNIFEVGDKVVFLDEPIIRTITDVFTIKRVDFDSLSTGLILSSRDYDGFGYQNQMRHATDEEIKAGKRLEVNQ